MDDPTATSADPAPPAGSSSTGDLLYDAFYGAAIGGSVIALFFLVVDSLGGRPLFTPSILGQALFTGADPSAADTIRLDMVAYFSAVHFASFLVLGGIVSYLCRMMGVAKTNFPVVTGVIFVMLGVAFFGADLLVLGGAAGVLGVPVVLAANLVTAIAMGLFLRRAHADD